MDKNLVDLLTSSCLHKIRIKDYYGNVQYVNCGKCSFCRNHTISVLRQRLQFELQFRPYCYAFTLTYDLQHLPLGYVSHNSLYISHLDKEIIINPLDYDSIKKRLSKDIPVNCIPVLNYKDIQLFSKRFRSWLRRHYNTNVRFFCTAEYGGKRFRPHFHYLLFSEKSIDFKAYDVDERHKSSSILEKLWKLGLNSYDGQPLNSSSLSTYLSNYVTSSINTPNIYRISEIKSKHFHSSYLGLPFNKVSPFLFYENVAKYVTQTPCSDFSIFPNYKLPKSSSITSYLFPLPFGFSLNPKRANTDLLTFYNCGHFKSFTEFLNSVESMTNVLNSLFINTNYYYKFCLTLDFDLMYKCLSSMSVGKLLDLQTDDTSISNLQSVIRRLMSAYYTSKHFCTRLLPFIPSVHYYIKKLYEYLDISSMHSLRTSLMYLELSSDSFLALPVYYVNTIETSSLVSDLENIQIEKIDNFVKHKVLSSKF